MLRVEAEGLVVVLDCVFELSQLAVGNAAVVVGLRRVGAQANDLIEVAHRFQRLHHLAECHASTVIRIRVVRVRLDGLVQLLHLGLKPGQRLYLFVLGFSGHWGLTPPAIK